MAQQRNGTVGALVTNTLSGSRRRSILTVLAILGATALVVIGRTTSPTFIADLSANLLADAVVAVMALVLATIALELPQRRQERIQAQEKAFRLLGSELRENEAELNLIVGVLRDRKLNPSDPVFHRDTVLQTENWKLLIQSPLVAHLPVDLVWSLHESYHVSQQEVRNLRHRIEGVFAAAWEWWEALSRESLPRFERALQLTQEAIEALSQSFVENQSGKS